MNGLKKPRRPRWPANRLTALNTLEILRPLDTEEAAKLGNEARMAWHRLTYGTGTEGDFDTVAIAMNASLVLSEPVGQAAVDIIIRAQHALVAMQQRYRRQGKFGPDAAALADVPPGLDLHDQLLTFINPRQLVAALVETRDRIECGDVLAPAHRAAALGEKA
jgi:hypothetical protein